MTGRTTTQNENVVDRLLTYQKEKEKSHEKKRLEAMFVESYGYIERRFAHPEDVDNIV